MLSGGPFRALDLFPGYFVRVAAMTLYAARSDRIYPGAQAVLVEHRDAPAAFIL